MRAFLPAPSEARVRVNHDGEWWRRRSDRAQDHARRTAAADAGAGRDQSRRRGLADPRLRVQGEPDGARPGRVQGTRCQRPARALRDGRRRGTLPADGAGPGREQPGLVVPVRRRDAELVHQLRRPRGRGDADPDLRGDVRPRPAADRGVRAGRRPARQVVPASDGGRSAGRAAGDPAADPDPAEPGPAVGGHRRVGAASAGRWRGRPAGPDRAPDQVGRSSRTSRCR